MKEKIIFNKLVRDNMIDIIRKNDQKCSYYTAENDLFKEKLSEKLLEEVKEFTLEKNEEEIADILEVLDQIIFLYKFNKNSILKIKEQKRIQRGGLKKGIILEYVENL